MLSNWTGLKFCRFVKSLNRGLFGIGFDNEVTDFKLHSRYLPN